MKIDNMMEVPLQFRTRKPPRRELYVKLFLLFLFGVFCAAVGAYVAPLPLPEPATKKGSDNGGVSGGDVEVFTFSTLSPEERTKLAELGARLSVPYLTPWGDDERPALFFMWHLLYRSIKPDLERLKAQRRNVTLTATPTVTTTTAAMAGPSEAPLEKVALVMDVVETEQGYITTSLARFLPEALIFSVVVNSTVDRRPFAPRPLDRAAAVVGSGRAGVTISPERRAYAEAVASKVERVLADPAAESIAEASQQPGANHLPRSTEAPVTKTTTTIATANAVVDGEGETTTATAAVLKSTAPNLFLCVPATLFNGSYYTAPETRALSVNYQVLLSPYIALRTAQTMDDFDAMLRAMLTRANVASFIVLPWLWQDADGGDGTVAGGGAGGGGGEAQPQRAHLYARELYDFDRWYGENEGYPLRILERALRVPEMVERYHLSIAPLGVKRWAGALRELFRVELTPIPEAATSTTPDPSAVATATPAALHPLGLENGGDAPPTATNETGTSPPQIPSTAPAALFGCATRASFLQCAQRTHHSSCDRFSDGLPA